MTKVKTASTTEGRFVPQKNKGHKTEYFTVNLRNLSH